MRQLVPREVVAAFPKAMLNIHPGFLPTFGGKGFYGERVHKAVIASGVRFTGPTVHFVDDNYDTGPIVAQRVIPVSPCDDHKHLAARVLKEVSAKTWEPSRDLSEGKAPFQGLGSKHPSRPWQLLWCAARELFAVAGKWQRCHRGHKASGAVADDVFYSSHWINVTLGLIVTYKQGLDILKACLTLKHKNLHGLTLRESILSRFFECRNTFCTLKL